MDEDKKAKLNKLEQESADSRTRFSLFTDAVGISRFFYNTRLVLGLGSIIAMLYLGNELIDATRQAERNLNIMTKVTRVIGTDEDGTMSEKGLQGLLDDLEFPIKVNKGDTLYSPSKYGSPEVELYLMRGKDQIYVGKRNLLDLKSYIGRHPEKTNQ